MKEAKGSRGSLVKLLEKYRAAVASIEMTLQLLDLELMSRKQRVANAMVDQALALDGARRKTKGPVAAKAKKAPKGTDRASSAKVLNHFSMTEPRQAPSGDARRLAVYIRHGYLAKKGDGYIRTEKQFAA